MWVDFQRDGKRHIPESRAIPSPNVRLLFQSTLSSIKYSEKQHTNIFLQFHFQKWLNHFC